MAFDDSGTARPVVGMDIGGTLAKVVLEDSEAAGGHPLVEFIRRTTSPDNAGALPAGWRASVVDSRRVLVFPTADMEQALVSIEAQVAAAGETKELWVGATGGGAARHKAALERRLGIRLVVASSELHAVARGLTVMGELEVGETALVCNVGTGVSLVSVKADGSIERVSGSGIGGATFWGLVRRLTRFEAFDDAIAAAAAEEGRTPGKVDTLVGDIYGHDASKAIGLPPDLVAGFLGQLDAPGLADADVVAALLRMVASNLGQLAVFQARLLETDAVWFTGGFVQSTVVRHAVAEAVRFWSGGNIGTRFPAAAEQLGAVGTMHS